MTDWRNIAKAQGAEPQDRVVVPLEALEQQMKAIEASVALETEPAVYYVLPFTAEDRS